MCVTGEDEANGIKPASTVPDPIPAISATKQATSAADCDCGFTANGCGADDSSICYKACCPNGPTVPALSTAGAGGGNSQCKCEFPCWVNNDGSQCFSQCCPAEAAKQAVVATKTETSPPAVLIPDPGQALAGIVQQRVDAAKTGLANALGTIVQAQQAAQQAQQAQQAAQPAAGAAAAAAPPAQPQTSDPQYCSCDFPCWLNHDGSTCFTHCCGNQQAAAPASQAAAPAAPTLPQAR